MSGQFHSVEGQRTAFGRKSSWLDKCGEAFIVGITRAGAIPLVEDRASSADRPLIGLPSFRYGFGELASGLLSSSVANGLRQEFGYEARDLVAMKSEFGGGDDPRWSFFLAPFLRATGWRARIGFVPGVHEVALADLRQYLSGRQRGGAMLDPHLRQGLFLAAGFFPQWAREKVRRGINELKAREPGVVSTA